MKIILAFFLYIVAGSVTTKERKKSETIKYLRTLVTPDVFPYVVLIPHRGPSGKKTACAGTILNSHWVLSSAACVYNMESDLSKNQLEVYAYASSSTQPLKEFKQIRQVEEMLPHPKHTKGTLTYNSGVLKVTRPFVFDAEFRRAIFYSVDFQKAQIKLSDMMYEFRQRKCENCQQPEYGKYDCKMVSWKMPNDTATPRLTLLEVIILAYDECDKINSEFHVILTVPISVAICVQPKRFDLKNAKPRDMVTPGHFYENADNGAPLICNEAGTDHYHLWGTFSQALYERTNGSTGKAIYTFFTTIESVLYKYHFDDPYDRKNGP